MKIWELLMMAAANAGEVSDGISVVGSTTQPVDATGDVTVPFPTGTQNGDFIVLLTARDSGDNIIPTGVTFRRELDDSSPKTEMFTGVVTQGVDVKVNTGGGDAVAVLMMIFRGVDTASPFITTTSSTVNVGIGGAAAIPAQSATESGLSLLIAALDDDGISGVTYSDSSVENVTFSATNPAGAGFQATVAIATRPASAPTAAGTTCTFTGGSDAWLGVHEILRPA